MKFSIALLALLPTALAHFSIQYPTAIGTEDEGEAEGPCAGYTVPSPLASQPNSTNASVDSFAISIKTSHPQSQWLFRATVSQQEPYDWTNILPVVNQASVGSFCLPTLRVPDNFAGQTGLIQIISDAPDGYLYNCAIVNFVAGSNTTVGSSCTNTTGVTISVTTQSNFTTNATTSGTTTGSSASATASSSASTMALQQSGFLGAIFAVVGGILML